MTAAERVILANTSALAVFEQGPEDAPAVILAHGWPDCHHVWDLVAPLLADRFRVVTYDMRGVGRSTPALTRRPYALEHLAGDLGAVIGAVGGGAPVHVVGHDWGSVVGWEAVQTPELQSSIASFTSISGPNLDWAGTVLRRRPLPLGAATDQLVRSAYTGVLSLPGVRTGIWRAGAAPAFRAWLRVSEGVRGYPGAGLTENAIAAVPLYRTNIWPRLLHPRLRPTDVPVQLVIATRDRYVSPALARTMTAWLPDMDIHEIDAGHWSPRTHPEALAAGISGFVASVEASTAGKESA